MLLSILLFLISFLLKGWEEIQWESTCKTDVDIEPTSHKQGSKKVPSGHLGQEDFPARQVTFHSHLPDGQRPRQVVCQLNKKKVN